MKIITEPEVYLIGRQTIVDSELDRFLEDHDVETWETDTDIAAQKLVEVSGRLCYASYMSPRPGGNKKYIEHILEVSHGSVTECAVFNFIVTNVSRSLSHELCRHRHLSLSMASQRYIDESTAEYVAPPDLQEEINAALFIRNAESDLKRLKIYLDDEDHTRPKFIDEDPKWSKCPLEKIIALATIGELWLQTIEIQHQTYVQLSSYLSNKAQTERPELARTDARKFARQAARSVLPNATETKLSLTFNARALRHFLELRASRHADPEIRKLAIKLYEVAVKEAPNLFGDYEKISLPDGTYELTTKYKNV